MDESLHNDLIHKIREISLNVDGIIGTEKCYIRKSGHQFYVDLHAIVDGKISVKKGHRLSHKLKDFLRFHIPSIENVLIHIEPYNKKNK
jgi:divalent metal cation (Fe/Co/Zn/Cd) transporter